MRAISFLGIFILPVLIPLLIVVGINSRQTFVTDRAKLRVTCNMACYYNTDWCKQNHSHILKPYFKLTDKAYFGLINFLGSGGNYEQANLVYLVIGWPVVMYLLLTNSLLMQFFLIKKK